MSKFEFNIFYGGYDTLAVSKEKYTKAQAIEIAKRELELPSVQKPYYIAIGNGWVRHRTGRNEDNEPCVGWWLEYEQYNRSCPCFVFHTAFTTQEMFTDYEYIEIC